MVYIAGSRTLSILFHKHHSPSWQFLSSQLNDGRPRQVADVSRTAQVEVRGFNLKSWNNALVMKED